MPGALSAAPASPSAAPTSARSGTRGLSAGAAAKSALHSRDIVLGLGSASHVGALATGGSYTTTASFSLPDGLEIHLAASEPDVRQPVSISFDERGRMWVVQYLQYPHPAGLKMLSRDKYWRAVYDKVPPPPPHHFRGKDKITIHEDTDGDGAATSIASPASDRRISPPPMPLAGAPGDR